jgi:hypothetical protein
MKAVEQESRNEEKVEKRVEVARCVLLEGRESPALELSDRGSMI